MPEPIKMKDNKQPKKIEEKFSPIEPVDKIDPKPK